MTKYQKIFTALSDTFDITPLNEEIDDFETCLNEQNFDLVDLGEKGYSYYTILDLLVDIANVASKRSSNIIYDGQDNKGNCYQSQHCTDIINYARKRLIDNSKE